jgi:predicted  nucleic acid-binding Zn-ribbon protein
MSKTITPEITTSKTIEYKAMLDQMFAEMKRVNKKMERDQKEIERLKTETDKTLARIQSVLNYVGKTY